MTFSGKSPAVSAPERTHRVANDNLVEAGRSEIGSGVAGEHTVRCRRKDLRRACLTAFCRRPAERGSCRDHVVIKNDGAAGDVADKQVAAHDATTALLIDKTRTWLRADRRRESMKRSARLAPPMSGETTASPQPRSRAAK